MPELPPVLFLLNSLGVGGSEGKFVRLANALCGRGASVTLAYLNPPTPLLAAVDSRVAVVHLHRRGKFSIRALRALVGTIRSRGVQVVIAVNLYPALYVQLARRLLDSPRLRFLVSVNTTDVATRKLALAMPLYRSVLRRADEVIFGAESQRRLWRERYGIGGPGRGTRVIYNGVDADHFKPERSTARSRPVIGTVGRMRPEKAQLDLVQATAALRHQGLDVSALIVGDGSERAAIEREIARLGLERHVTLAGETSEVRPFLARMDVFVLTSTGIETFSNAALEAMACGIPVVSAAIGGMAELLAFGGGIAYPPGDVAKLTACLAQLLEDRERRARMSRAARRAVLEHFSWNDTLEQFIEALAPSGAELSRAEPRRVELR